MSEHEEHAPLPGDPTWICECGCRLGDHFTVWNEHGEFKGTRCGVEDHGGHKFARQPRP